MNLRKKTPTNQVTKYYHVAVLTGCQVMHASSFWNFIGFVQLKTLSQAGVAFNFWLKEKSGGKCFLKLAAWAVPVMLRRVRSNNSQVTFRQV